MRDDQGNGSGQRPEETGPELGGTGPDQHGSGDPGQPAEPTLGSGRTDLPGGAEVPGGADVPGRADVPGGADAASDAELPGGAGASAFPPGHMYSSSDSTQLPPGPQSSPGPQFPSG